MNCPMCNLETRGHTELVEGERCIAHIVWCGHGKCENDQSGDGPTLAAAESDFETKTEAFLKTQND